MKNEKINEIVVHNEPYHYSGDVPLLSIHLASNRPVQFAEFVQNIHDSCDNKNVYEIIVKIDTEDTQMIQCVASLVKKYGETNVKPFVSPRKDGPWSTWEAYNEMFLMTHPDCYFLWNPSDEVRIDTPSWDKILVNYIGFFKDHVFRLKLSDNRLHNYYHLYEILGTPDNFPFITKKWMDICGLWGDCHSPDVFHQAVSFYLGNKAIFRDVPIFNINLSGIEAGLLIPAEKMRSRTKNIYRLWRRALSNAIRKRYLAHATKLKFYIDSSQQSATEITFKEYTNSDLLHCSNNLGYTVEVKCKDRVHWLSQAHFELRLIFIRLRDAFRHYKGYITLPFKFFLGWHAFHLIPTEQKQQKLAGVKQIDYAPIKRRHYFLVKYQANWELFHCDYRKHITPMSIPGVEGLADELKKLPNKSPDLFLPRECRNLKRKIVLHHLKTFFKLGKSTQ
ncbi:MAG: hypothetical protein A3E84_05815 [Gammaproteobacteria bacterium RIFCSPHIGHO2_12_FULL_42_13]|nr:MAG: hypothetical protein A3E84_05815 [Gammaproteobacteria bacterium RIFCSPHIGHO2_12_FULL_42_13]